MNAFGSMCLVYKTENQKDYEDSAVASSALRCVLVQHED